MIEDKPLGRGQNPWSQVVLFLEVLLHTLEVLLYSLLYFKTHFFHC